MLGQVDVVPGLSSLLMHLSIAPGAGRCGNAPSVQPTAASSFQAPEAVGDGASSVPLVYRADVARPYSTVEPTLAWTYYPEARVAIKPIRVLAIDGGGIRGYLPALLLAEIERRSGLPATELFDLIAGTSTGGIIALGVAMGRPAKELAEFYPRFADAIFGMGDTLGSQLWKGSQRLGSIFGGNPRYAGNARHFPQGLEQALKETFGDYRLSQSKVELAITSFDGRAALPVVFSRRDALLDPAFDLPMRLVARATSAAPTFFPPLDTSWAGRSCSFVDGGVWANNPAGVAVVESMRMTAAAGLTATSVVLASLGTGIPRSKPAFDGVDAWIGTAGDVMATATSVVGGDILADRAVPASQLFRLQVVDDNVAGPMDDPSPGRLRGLNDAAKTLIRQQTGTIDALVSSLTR